jgi:glycosyltransferase involved in cell wall biosynthesis
MSRPHLLYIAFAFPPSTASSVYRCMAVANNFVESGWDVTVITLDADIWSMISGVDEGLAQSVDPRVKVVHVGDHGAEEPAKRDLRRYSRLRIEAPYIWRELHRRRISKDFPENFHAAWLKPASEAARSVHAGHPVDLVMASANPYVSFGVARALEGVPYVMDYRDAWAFNTITGTDDFSPESEKGRLEASYLKDAAQVWFVNEPIRQEYAKRYPFATDKMRVVENGFDPQPGHAKPVVKPSAHPSFGYLGTLQYVNMPLDPFLAGWKLAFGRAEVPSARAVFRGKLSSSGTAPAEVLAAFSAAEATGLHYEGPISKRDVARFYGSMDALILLLSTGKYVTGGKTMEYLATGRPIVSVHDLGNAATELMRDYPLWFPARDLSPEGIAEALLACADAVAAPDLARWDAAWDYGQQFARSSILAPVIAELRGIAGFGANTPAATDGTESNA